MSYGQIAAEAGNHRAARQVSWILKNSSEKFNLPWQRVVNCQRKISLPIQQGGDLQRQLLESEGVRFHLNGVIEKEFVHHS